MDNYLDKKSLERCRLHYGLNEDCLCMVFDYLSLSDLIQLCELDLYFQDLIKNRVIEKKLININNNSDLRWTNQRIFKVFGQKIRKISGDIENLLKLTLSYCEPNTITDLYVDFHYKHYSLSSNILQESMPYFSNVRKLVLYRYVICDEFIETLLKSTINLKTLTLSTTDFITKEMITAFGKNETKLRKLKHQVIPNWTRFDLDDTQNRYNSFFEINNLKHLTLTSQTYCGSELYFPLLKLAAKNKLETFKVYIDQNYAIKLKEEERLMYAHTFDHFTSLKRMDITIKMRDDEDDHCAEFLYGLMSKLKSLHQVNISIEGCLRDVYKILEITPYIHVLNVSQVTLKWLPVEMGKIIRTAKKITENQQDKNQPLLHLLLNERQWHEVQVYKDINKILNSHCLFL